MITKSDVLDELIQWLDAVKQEALDLADQETQPLMEAKDNPEDDSYKYAKEEYSSIITHMNDVVTFIDELTLVLENEPLSGIQKWKA